MPYLPAGELRSEVDRLAEATAKLVNGDADRLRFHLYSAVKNNNLPTGWNGGCLNRYVCQCYCFMNPRNYAQKEAVWGAIMEAAINLANPSLRAAAMEIYRRDIGPYEDAKAMMDNSERDLLWPVDRKDAE